MAAHSIPLPARSIFIALDDEKSHERIGDADVLVEVTDPRGRVEKKPLLRTQGGGLRDYSELFQFSWSGEYIIRTIITLRPSTLAVWHADHVNFAKLLDLLEAQLELFHESESPQYELMLDIMYYMTHYCDVLHHPKEDLVFAKIKQRRSSIGSKVDDLTKQHARLKVFGERLVHDLDGIVNGSITSRDRVESDARTYLCQPAQPHAVRGSGDPATGGRAARRQGLRRRSIPRSGTSTTRCSGRASKPAMPRCSSR